MTIILAIWGALLSTVLGCLTLYDRYIKRTGRVRIAIEKFNGYWEFDFTRPVRRLDGDRIPTYDDGQPDVSAFDSVYCFKIFNTSDTPVEIRFAQVYLRMGYRRRAHLWLDHRPLGDKLVGRHDYCVYAVCESVIANGHYFHDKPCFPAKCYLEVTTTTGRRFRSKCFYVDDVFEEELGEDDSYILRKLDYSKRRGTASGAQPPERKE